ncbi:MAG: tetratricopeptide repeat protein [Gemmatimonadales bacterium]
MSGLGEPPDYYGEGLRLAGEERYHEALTSFRLALRRQPDDPGILQQMAVIYTRIGMPEEAVRHYEAAIETGGDATAAHYGLAFLLLRSGNGPGARAHLEAFLRQPPQDEDASAHIEHARQTLERLESGGSGAEEPEVGSGE